MKASKSRITFHGLSCFIHSCFVHVFLPSVLFTYACYIQFKFESFDFWVLFLLILKLYLDSCWLLTQKFSWVHSSHSNFYVQSSMFKVHAWCFVFFFQNFFRWKVVSYSRILPSFILKLSHVHNFTLIYSREFSHSYS